MPCEYMYIKTQNTLHITGFIHVYTGKKNPYGTVSANLSIRFIVGCLLCVTMSGPFILKCKKESLMY